MSQAEKAREFFLSGANCAQAVAGAFADVCHKSEEELFQLACGFGGGMGRMREVCGAVSAMVLVSDLLYAPEGIADKAAKDAQYARVQELAARFKAKSGSIICRELLHLGKEQPESAVSSARTPAYYQKRPCVEMVALAAEILENYIAENAPR